MSRSNYDVHVTYGEASVTSADLVQWNRGRVRQRAARLVSAGTESVQEIPFGSILVSELQDCIDRGGEQFSPQASLPLELFWTASRGVYTYYSALELGHRSRDGYLTFASVGALGEGLALFVLEDRWVAPGLFGLELMYRPLGDSPDLLMYYASEPDRLALVEAKATLGEDVGPLLQEATATIIEIFKGWQQHRPLASTDAFAVATSLGTEGRLHTYVLKLRWAGA